MMRWTGVAAGLLAAAMVSADDKPKADAKKELEPFQGTWTVVSIESSGHPLPEDELKEMRLVIKGDERVVMAGDEVRSKATFTVDATKKPPTMDVKVSEGPLAGKTVKGIYELKDDGFKLCLALEGDKRPDDFTAKEGSGRLLQVYKKAKKDAPAKPKE